MMTRSKTCASALDLIEAGKQPETHMILLEELGDVYRLLRDIGQAIAIYHDSLHLWETLPEGRSDHGGAVASQNRPTGDRSQMEC